MFEFEGGLEIEHVTSAIDHLIQEATDETAKLVLERGNQLVPFDTGALEESGHIRRGLDESDVVYFTRYAAILHAHPEWSYQGGRSARWLEEAMADPAIASHLGSAIRDRWPTE